MGRPFLLHAALAACLVAAAPAPLLFYGEDWGGDPRAHPNAAAARDGFLAHLDVPAVEDFEGISGRVLRLPLGGYGARVIGGARDSVSATVLHTPGRHATSARRFFEHGSEVVVIELERPVEAVGFYAIDVGDAGGTLRVTLADATGAWEEAFPVPHPVVPRGDGRGEGAVVFFGVIVPGRQITRIELRNVGDGGDGFGYDDLVVGRLRRPAI